MISLFSLPKLGTINLDYATHLLHGAQVGRFEDAWKHRTGFAHVVAVNSATNAITIVLKALEMVTQKSPLVQVPAMIPPVVPNAVFHALPFGQVDWVDNDTWVGGPYRLAACGDYSVIDSAQSVRGGGLRGPMDVVIYSFYPTKPLGGIDGGIICSDDKKVIDLCRALAYNGMDMKLNSWERSVMVPGYKAYMSTVQAEVLLRQMPMLEGRMAAVDNIRERYNQEFGLGNTSSHLYRVDVAQREEFMAQCKEVGIVCGVHYRCCADMDVWGFDRGDEIVKCRKSQHTTVSIPMHADMTRSDVDLVVREVSRWRSEHPLTK